MMCGGVGLRLRGSGFESPAAHRMVLANERAAEGSCVAEPEAE